MIRDLFIFCFGAVSGALANYLGLVCAGYHFRNAERRERQVRRALYLDEAELFTNIPPRYQRPENKIPE